MEKILQSKWFVIIISVITIWVTLTEIKSCRHDSIPPFQSAKLNYWVPPSFFLEPVEPGENRPMLIYGEELIAHTANFIGPKGTVAALTNGMNCENCHLEAGAKPFGNNYSAVASTYPKFRERSGSIETIEKRVNDCIERSLNGKPLDSNSREMQAIVAYIKWLGKHVQKGEKPMGSGITRLKFLDRPANPVAGKIVFLQNCQKCHGRNGEGLKDSVHVAYIYPPLWGEHSYNSGAGLYRLSTFAGYVKDNMPFGTTDHFHPQLTDEEAWDVAAFVNSQPRPSMDLSKDWPDISAKPFDHPFGPYSDGFSELQHKYGPFAPIKKAKDDLKKKSN